MRRPDFKSFLDNIPMGDDFEAEHRKRTRINLFAEHATLAEVGAAQTPEQLDELEAVCTSRRNAKLDAEYEAAKHGARAVASYDAMVDGKFPPRLIVEAWGKRLGTRRGQFSDASNTPRIEPAPVMDTPAMLHAGAFMANPDLCLALFNGYTGTGKTFAMTRLAAEIGGGHPGYIRATTLERAGRYDHDMAKWIASRSFLAIDDLGAEFFDAKGSFRSIIEEIVDDHWGDRRPLVITTNLPTAQIVERYGARVWSRFAQAGAVYGCGSVDLRRGDA